MAAAGGPRLTGAQDRSPLATGPPPSSTPPIPQLLGHLADARLHSCAELDKHWAWQVAVGRGSSILAGRQEGSLGPFWGGPAGSAARSGDHSSREERQYLINHPLQLPFLIPAGDANRDLIEARIPIA